MLTTVEQRYKVTGMTCGSCKASVEKYISGLSSVAAVSVDLEKGTAIIQAKEAISLAYLQDVLPEKYQIQPEKNSEEDLKKVSSEIMEESKTKLQQLYPLLLIFLYLLVTSNLLHWKAWNLNGVMLDFMGLFYIVFSFFKILDLKGFPESFQMYDPLAKRIPFYARIYPFIETALGLMLLLRFQVQWALIVTLFILSITSFGVIKSLMDKKAIRCACLGTALKLPMTEATIIENVLMLIMAGVMLSGIL